MSNQQHNEKCLQAAREAYKQLPVSRFGLFMLTKGQETFRDHSATLVRQSLWSWAGLLMAAAFALIFGLNGETIAAVSSIVLSVVLLLVASSL